MSGAGVELLVEPYELGFRKAKEFMLTGDKIDAQEAWRLGLVNRVVPRGGAREGDHRARREGRPRPADHREMIKDSINRTQDLGGKQQSWRYHFMVHQFTSQHRYGAAHAPSAQEEVHEGGLRGARSRRRMTARGRAAARGPDASSTRARGSARRSAPASSASRAPRSSRSSSRVRATSCARSARSRTATRCSGQ
jgi:hypothetical protein